MGVLVVLFVAANHARRAADPPPPAPIVENARVRVWDVAPGGTPAPALPGRDAVIFIIRGTAPNVETDRVVVTYLADGALTSTDTQGKGVTNEHYFGLTKFNASNRVHTEKLERGQASAMMVEIK